MSEQTWTYAYLKHEQLLKGKAYKNKAKLRTDTVYTRVMRLACGHYREFDGRPIPNRPVNCPFCKYEWEPHWDGQEVSESEYNEAKARVLEL